ncbi:MAG: hypothetical protein ABR511_15330 [Acidimicrobiales bacterium]
MSGPPVSAGRRRASTALLAVGYPMASWAGGKLVPTFRQRRARRFAVLEVGTALVTTGLAVRRRRLLALLNASALAAFTAVWVAGGRRRS